MERCRHGRVVECGAHATPARLPAELGPAQAELPRQGLARDTGRGIDAAAVRKRMAMLERREPLLLVGAFILTVAILPEIDHYLPASAKQHTA